MNLSVKVKQIDEFNCVGYVLLQYDGSIWHPIFADRGVDKHDLYRRLLSKVDDLSNMNIVYG